MKIIEQVNLNIILQGRVMMSEQECSKNSKGYDSFTMKILSGYKKVKTGNKIEKQPVFELLPITTRRQRTIFKNMSFNKEQIKAFVETPTQGISPAFWKTLPIKVRIEKHCEEIVHDNCGLGYSLQYVESSRD